jgi:hypothetical protein
MAKTRISGLDLLLQDTSTQIPSGKEELARIDIWVPERLKKKMKVFCAVNGQSMQDFITSLIEWRMNRVNDDMTLK